MIFDFHNDFIWENLTDKEKHAYLIANDSSVIVSAFWTTDKTFDIMDGIVNSIQEFSRHKNVLFAIEDLHFVTEDNLSALTALPLIYCTPAWKHDNAVAGGHLGESGVTVFGKKVFTELSKNRIAVDTAHLNEKSFYGALEYSENVLNSHTCQNDIYMHTRNLTDIQIKRLIERGGLLCLTAVDSFLSVQNACRRDYLFQLLRAIEKFGDGNLAIGTDFYGAPPLKGLCRYEHFNTLRYELEKSGCSKETIDKIFFINAQKFCNKLKRLVNNVI